MRIPVSVYKSSFVLFFVVVVGNTDRAYAQSCTDVGTCGGVGSCPIGKICAPFLFFNNLGSCTTDGAENCPGNENTGTPCSPAGCSETNGCGLGYSCKAVKSGLFCQPDASCQLTGYNTCQPVNGGCSCGPGRKCVNTGSTGWQCIDSPGQCGEQQQGYNCSPIGACGGQCGPGRRCVSTGQGTFAGSVCNADASCSIQACTSNGCDPQGPCGSGYSCQNNRCIIDTTCIGGTVQSPYNGPKIKSFSTLMAAVYNLLYPAAILLGVIMNIGAGYKLMTSQGDPRKTKEGQEDLTAAILGTAFVVLSAVILRIIIGQILGGTAGF